LPTTSHVSHLAEKRNVTVVVRLLIDRREQLVHGEVVDMDGKAQGRFDGWRELIRTMREYLMSREY